MGSCLPSIPAKRYFTIGEVADLCGVKPHVLRYWEQEFSLLRPMKRRGNRRYYQHHEVLMVRSIRELLYEQGFTINSARNKLQELVQGERVKPCNKEVLPDAIDGPDDVNTSFQRLEESVELNYGKGATQPFLSVRQELFEIRDLLSEVV